MATYPFRNLVFQGGGVKTFAYHGALRVLEEQGILPHIERVAGTSAGALLAVLVSFRLSVEETIALFKTVDYSKIAVTSKDLKWPRKPPPAIEREVEGLLGSLSALGRLVRGYGWYTQDYPDDWVKETIAAQCQGNGRATFADFRRQGFRDVAIVAANISAHSITVFSADTTPDVAVVDAVLMSGSIPFFFQALRFDGTRLGAGDYYADGGLLMNYPIHVFDDPRYEKGNPWYKHSINWQTLGCRLYTPQDCGQKEKPITNIIGYVENLFETLVEAQVVDFENSAADQLRTINISNCGVRTTDFDIRPAEGDARYEEMVQAGESAARDYLAGYELPGDTLDAIQARFAEFLARWKR